MPTRKSSHSVSVTFVLISNWSRKEFRLSQEALPKELSEESAEIVIELIPLMMMILMIALISAPTAEVLELIASTLIFKLRRLFSANSYFYLFFIYELFFLLFFISRLIGLWNIRFFKRYKVLEIYWILLKIFFFHLIAMGFKTKIWNSNE